MAALGPGSPLGLGGDKCWPATPELDFFHTKLELSHLVLNETPRKAFLCFYSYKSAMYLKSSSVCVSVDCISYDTMEESNFLQQHRETSLDIRGLDIRGREISRILSMTWMYTIRVGNYSYRNNLEQCGWIFWGH